jgi:hypothetical protein
MRNFAEDGGEGGEDWAKFIMFIRNFNLRRSQVKIQWNIGIFKILFCFYTNLIISQKIYLFSIFSSSTQWTKTLFLDRKNIGGGGGDLPSS